MSSGSVSGGQTDLETAAALNATSASSHAEDLTKVAAGTTINLLGSIVRTVLTFAYAVFLATVLDPASVGLFFLGYTVMILLATAATMGLDTGVIRFTSLFDGEGDRQRVRGIIAGAVAVAVPVSVGALLAMFLIAGPVSGQLFEKPDLTPVLRIFALAIPLYVIARLFNSATQGLRYMRYQVYSRDLGEQVARFAISGVLLLAGFGVMGMVWANIGALVLAVSLSLAFMHRVESVFGRKQERTFEQRRLLNYTTPLAVSALISLLLLWTDTLILGKYAPAEQVGIYSVAMRMAAVGSVILVSFNTIFAPLASDFFNRGEKARLENLLKSTTKWVICFSLPAFAGLALFPEQALRLMGSSYATGKTALIILAIGQLVNAAAGPVVLLLMMCGRPRIVLVNNITVFLIDILLCFLLIPKYGIEGAALASAVTLILLNLGALTGVMSILKLKPFSIGYGKIAGAGVISIAITILVKNLLPHPWNLIISLVAFVFSYAMLVYLNGFDESDTLVIGALKARLARKA